MKYFSHFIALLSYITAHGQRVISGVVTDSQSGEQLVGVSVKLVNTDIGCVSNKYGFFSTKAPNQKYTLRFSYIGYETQLIDIDLRNDTMLTVQMSESSMLLNETTIRATDNASENAVTGKINIPISRLKAIPTILGESDVFKALSMTPGITIGNEGTANILVRGGTPDQNMILLDDVSVYNVSHLFGIISIFNADAIKNIDVYKAGFPARYGGRISSVIDITMNEGNNKQAKREVSVGMLSSKFLLEGPISIEKTGKSSYMVSLRSSYLTPFLLPQIISFNAGKAENAFNYWMYDLNAKVNYQLKNKGQFFLSMYRGQDFWSAREGTKDLKSIYRLNWGNQTYTARYNKIIKSKIFLKSVLAYSKFDYFIGNSTKDKGKADEYSLNSSLDDITFKTDIDYFYNNKHDFKIGVQNIIRKSNPSFVKITNESIDVSKINQSIWLNELALYAEDNYHPVSWFRSNIGLRFVNYSMNTKSYYTFEPRINLNFLFPNQFQIKGSYTKMNQFIHLLSSNSVGLPNDIWVPATEKVPPQQSEQFSLGFYKSFGNAYEFSVENYYKTYTKLIDYQTGKSFLSALNQSWESIIYQNGIGKSYGSEFFLNKTKGLFTGWVGYTLAYNQRRFDEINDGNWFDANFDRRHYLNITANYTTYDDKFVFSANWVYHTGQPTTVPIAVSGTNKFNLIYGNRNNFRMPDYHRLDVSMSIKGMTKKHRDRTWTFGLYNAYNRKNPYYLDLSGFSQSEAYTTNRRLLQKSVLPIIPSISYNLKLK